jgi:DNA recombination protein RmuC
MVGCEFKKLYFCHDKRFDTMPDTLFIILGFLAGGLLGGALGWLLGKDRQKNRSNATLLELTKLLSTAESESAHTKVLLENLKQEFSTLNQTFNNNQAQLNDATRRSVFLEAENRNLHDKLASQRKEFDALHEKFTLEFQNVANRIFDEKTKRFNELSGERLDTLLNPLTNNLKEFKEKVTEAYDKEARERFSLTKEIANLMELNRRISDEANNLTQALKGDNKMQGDWGEMILENILEASGLREGVEYVIQTSLREDEGDLTSNQATGKTMRPDVVVHYPGDRDVIIDAKVSLTAYSQYVATDDPKEKEAFRKEHLRSVKNHIDELNKKDYAGYDVKALEFVMMFIPNEPSYNLALQADPTLWEYAYHKKVVMMSPTNLIAALRMAMDLWKREFQVRNIQTIVKQATLLYEKFVGFATNFEKIGQEINAAQKVYNDAYGQLTAGPGNLVRRVEQLRKLGLSPSKTIPNRFIEPHQTNSNTNQIDS